MQLKHRVALQIGMHRCPTLTSVDFNLVWNTCTKSSSWNQAFLTNKGLKNSTWSCPSWQLFLVDSCYDTIKTYQMFFKWCTCASFWPSELPWCVDKCVQQCLPNYASHAQKCKCSPRPGQPVCQDISCPAEKQFVSIFYKMCVFIQLFYPITSNVWCFSQIFIFPQLFKAPVWWRPNAVVVGALFQCSRLISIAVVY